MSEPALTEGLQLARLVGARLVHDLVGPLGTVKAAAGLGTGGPRSNDMLVETVEELMARARLYAAVFGHAEPFEVEDMPALLAGAPGAHRVQFRIAPDVAGTPHALLPVVLAATMLAAEALPRGGSVTVGAGPGDGTVIMPEGRMAAWPHGLLERLGGLPPPQPETARGVLAPWLIGLAADAGCHLSLGLGGPGIPPLLLRPG